MEMYLDCAICIQKQALQIARIATNELSLHEKILKSSMEVLLKEDWHRSPLEMARRVQDIATEVTAVVDPYKELKRESNKTAMKLVPVVEERMLESQDPLKVAIKGAIAGNIMDFGALDSFDIEKTLEKALNDPMELKDYKLFREKLKSTRIITYIADNSGEIVFDGILLREISKLENIEKLRLVVRDKPLINDVTEKDIEDTNIPDIPKIGIDSLPIDGEKATNIVKEWIKESDVTISKGQGNYEMFSSLKDIFFLLIVKCDILSKDIGEPKGSVVLKYR